jgi:AcrR family transcriptional regulator
MFAIKNNCSLKMQKLKPEIQDRILNESLSMFYKQGYEKTSTRDIAGKVGISVSNLYKYFENKEAIFDAVVKDYYSNYKAKLASFLSHNEKDTFGEDRVALLTTVILESFARNHKEFVILMNKSGGTKYESFKDEVIGKLEQHIRRGIGKHAKNEFIITVYARNFFHGIVEIAGNYKSKKWAYNNLYLLVKYHMNGIAVLYK